MTVNEFLSRASSAEITEEMAFDLLEQGALTTIGRVPPPLPEGAARRIRLDDPNVLDALDRYWPPGS